MGFKLNRISNPNASSAELHFPRQQNVCRPISAGRIGSFGQAEEFHQIMDDTAGRRG
jgi:hypothetical protein